VSGKLVPLPGPGEESDSDTDDEAPARVFGADIDAFRRRRKARKPHVVAKTSVALPGAGGTKM
jgi:hypothetical protein